MKKIKLSIKRYFDIAFALAGVIPAFSIIGLTALLVKINSPQGSPFFRQIRIGYHGKKIVIMKIRTMTNERDENGKLLADSDRLKKWGKIIRKLSIDELPQIFAVLKGEMSWIGPRPLLPKQMQVMTIAEQKERQSMLPGITGWEAVNEEKSDSRRKMAEYDLDYVRNWSLCLDLKILCMTIRKLFHGNRAEEQYRAPKLRKSEIRNG